MGSNLSMNFRAALIPLHGGAPYEVIKDMIIVGRKSECDLCLDHKGISKLHCVVVKTDGLLVLRDLGSTNGTRVNGTRVRRAALLPNDKVSFANYHFKIHLGPEDAPIIQSEHTLAMDLGELPKIGPDSEPDLSAKMKPVEVLRNELPDVYPDDGKKKE
jgi:pSer/pThr/pTyr-binding forkhead associated (FHA) protein